MLTYGVVPFKASDMQTLYNKIIVGKFSHPKNYYSSIELVDLIGKMLVVDVNKRYSVDKVLAHPWFRNCGSYEPKSLKDKQRAKKVEGILLWLQTLGFSEEFLKQSVDKKLFNHVKACIESLINRI